MDTLKDIEEKLNSLTEYINHFVNRRVNEELLDLHHFIMPFDQWYEAGTDFKRNEIIATCGIRRTGRTRAMVENVIDFIKQGKNTLIIIEVKNSGQIDYIIDEFAKLVGIDKVDKNRLLIKGYPDTIIKFISNDNLRDDMHYYRGRKLKKEQIFADHYTYETSFSDTIRPIETKLDQEIERSIENNFWI